MKGKYLFLGMIALGVAAGCSGGATEPLEPASQPRYNVSDAAPADSVGASPTGAAFGGIMAGSGS